VDWAQIWPLISVILGGGGFLTVALQEWGKWRSGRADEERQENLTLAQRLEYAEAMREYEASYRRLTAEHASQLRGKLYELGYTPDQVGTWPTPPTKPEPPNKK